MLAYFAAVLVRCFEKREESRVRFLAGAKIFSSSPERPGRLWPTAGLNVTRLGESQSF
jgi:hypothetical protein